MVIFFKNEINLLGLIEIHKFLRKYYISYYENKYFDSELKSKMICLDNLQLKYYKLLRGVKNYNIK